jgi:hypothetical protein
MLGLARCARGYPPRAVAARLGPPESPTRSLPTPGRGLQSLKQSPRVRRAQYRNPGKLEERQGYYETRTEWHRVYAWRSLSKFATTLQKGQLITLEGTLRYREVEDEVKGTTFKHHIAEVHAASMKRLSKIEAADDPSDVVRIEAGHEIE